MLDYTSRYLADKLRLFCVVLAYWRAVSKEAATDIVDVLDMAYRKVVSTKPMRFAINEAQLAASMLPPPSDFHFLHQAQSKGAHGLLYEYCRLVVRYVMPIQSIRFDGGYC
jgi:hypothetical protein